MSGQTILTSASAEQEKRWHDAEERRSAKGTILVDGFLAAYRSGDIAFKKLCELAWRVVRDEHELAGDRNRLLGYVVKEALESQTQARERGRGPSRTPAWIKDTTVKMVRLAHARDGKPLTSDGDGAFEAVATAWKRWGVQASRKSVENWYYVANPRNSK